jgi:uncharacterized paraquat-inducible protein A
MPTIWTDCPQCRRPIETDYEEDGQSVTCPSCDASVPVPRPLLFKTPNLVWIACGLLLLIPFVVSFGFVNFYNNFGFLGPAAFLAMLMILPGFLLVRASKAGWTILVIVVSVLLAGALLCSTLGVALLLFMMLGEAFLWTGIPTSLVSAALLTVLLSRTMREWCKR